MQRKKLQMKERKKQMRRVLNIYLAYISKVSILFNCIRNYITGLLYNKSNGIDDVSTDFIKNEAKFKNSSMEDIFQENGLDRNPKNINKQGKNKSYIKNSDKSLFDSYLKSDIN